MVRDTEMEVDVSHLDHILDVTESPTRDIWGSRALTVVRVRPCFRILGETLRKSTILAVN